MAEPFTYLAPTRLEARHLGRGLDAGRIEVTGMGRRRALDAGRRVHNPYGAVAVAGVGGGLSDRLTSGDVVVADSVRADGDGAPRPVPGARLLAGALRRHGVPVTVGPVVSTTRPVVGRRRERLAATGAVCADMESAWLAGGEEQPFALLRVVADDAASPVLHPRTVGKMSTALAGLDRVGPALDAWTRALGERTVLVAGPRSFCAGVVRAIDIVEAALAKRGAPIYVRKEIVHNVHVVDDLRRRGAVFVEGLDEVPRGSTVVFSAHGVSPEVRADAAARGLDVIDATCPLVSKVHAEVRRFARADNTVIFIGHAGHDETLGTMGEQPDRTLLVQDVADAQTVAVPDPDHVSYLVQTTLAADEVAEVVDVLSARFPALQAPPSDDICYATTNRQQALQSVANEADLCLVVGSQNSSNSRRLVERSLRLGTPAYLIDDVDDIDLAWLEGTRVIGLTAGASAPMALVDEVVDALRGLGPVGVEHRDITVEDTHFTLPKEVR